MNRHDILSDPEQSRHASLDELIQAAKTQEGPAFWLNKGPVMKDGKLDPVAVDITRLRRNGRHYKIPTSDAEHPDPFDLENLLFTTPEQVRDFLAKLEIAAKVAKSRKKLVLSIIGNGGTICMLKRGKKTVPGLSAAQVVELCGKILDNMYEVEAFDLMSIDSSQYQWLFTSDCTIVVSYIMANASEDLLDVICWEEFNGTDTATEGSSNQKAQLGPEFDAGFGVACANVDSSTLPTDVPASVLCTAESLAYQHKSRHRGVFLSTGGNNGRAINPFWARKERDGHVNIFESPRGKEYLDIGHFFSTRYTDLFARQYRKALKVAGPQPFSPVLLDGKSMSAGLGVDLGNPAIVLDSRVGESPLEILMQIRLGIELGKRWLILNTYGGFTGLQQKLAVLDALKPDINIIATSPFARGGVHQYESALYIRDHLGGVITTMSEHAIMIKLMLAETIWPKDIDRQREFLSEHDYCGEQTRYKKATYKSIGVPRELMQRKMVKQKKSFKRPS